MTHTLAWFEDNKTPTRYAQLHIWHQASGMWRVLATDDDGVTDVTGPTFRTKGEAFAVLDEIARHWGCSEAG